ncbi:ROK family protein [Streptomyces sp. NBC_00829]|uniref:ROK family protein n=1 Tax=Streptomyces sp. NBC_00829 TaxID=2903679 RepID=UPI003867EAE7|nr:ROK family protein [Streptomyces sp. NBC_00829]
MNDLLHLGADIGGTKTEAVLTAADGTVLAHRRVATPALDGPDAVLATVTETLRRLRDRAGRAARIEGIGLGTHGIVSHPDGTVTHASQALPGWTGTPLRRAVEDSLGLPVVVDNDVNTLAFAEMTLGAGAGHHNLLFVTVGTGIGGAVITGGNLLRGSHGSGGELGHAPSAAAAGLPCSCGGTGHLDTVASGTAIARAYHHSSGRPLDTRQIADLASAADPHAQHVLAAAASALGEAIGGLVSVLDPDLVVVAGGVASSGPCWWDPLRTAARAATLPPLSGITITGPRLTHAAAARGAAALAAHTFAPNRPQPQPCVTP